jgi:hypothetical protein
MSNAFAPIVRARPNPIFGRPVHQGSPPIDYSPILLLKPFGFRIAPDTLSSDENLVGQRGITPAFGYSAPHPSAGGTLTLLIHALPSAHYEPVRLPTSARMMAPAVPCHHPPPETNPADPVGPLRFQRWPSMHDVAHDPGGATPSRLAMAHMLPSLDATSSASANLNLSRLNTDALHGSCLRFGPRVTATPARLGSGLPATALAR